MPAITSTPTKPTMKKIATAMSISLRITVKVDATSTPMAIASIGHVLAPSLSQTTRSKASALTRGPPASARYAMSVCLCGEAQFGSWQT